MNFYKSKTYIKDLELAVESVVNFNSLNGSTILVTGASGLIGSYIVDLLLISNKFGFNFKIYALARNIARLKNRFSNIKCKNIFFLEHDVNLKPFFSCSIDYIIHAASSAYPALFNRDPVGTILNNIQGTKHLLDYTRTHGGKRFLYVSSGEVYGQGNLLLDSFDESYGGYVDPTSPRSCYPNSKRTAETLCVSYSKQFGLDTAIVRPSHTYGPNTTNTDNRASVQFFNKGISGEDIILHSAGNQLRSYTFVTDVATAILTVLINGKSNEAYNIANNKSCTTIAGFAQIVAKYTGTKIVFSDPDEVALAERSPIAKQVLSNEKLRRLGWNAKYDIENGIAHTIDIMNECGL